MKERNSIYSSPYIFNPMTNKCNAQQINLEEFPTVSFVIPVYNSKRTLEKCLKSIKEQNYPKIELIVVDNGSKDDSIRIAEQYADKIIFDDGPLGSVRQKGIDNASGEIIGSFDSDNYLPSPTWLSEVICLFNSDKSVANIWPENIAPQDATNFTKMYLKYGNLVLQRRIKNNHGFQGGNGLFIKSKLLKIGGFDRTVHWGEDFNLAKKILAKYKIVYTNNFVYHDTNVGASTKDFIRKQLNYYSEFSDSGCSNMGLSYKSLLYEHTLIGFSGMIKGLLINREKEWITYPYFLFLRIYVFILVKLYKRVSK